MSCTRTTLPSPLFIPLVPLPLRIRKTNMPPKGSTTRRQYSVVDLDTDAGSSASEGTTRAAPKRKTAAKPAAANKVTATKKAPASKGPTVAKFYKDSIKAIEADLKALDAQVRKLGPNTREITTDTYADKSLDHLKSVEELEKVDGGLSPAFNLMLYVADASHNDCQTTVKMSGFGDSEEPFGILDARPLDLIEKRHAQSPATRQDELPTVPKRWTRQDADVGEFKTGRPNKQQYGQMEKQKLEWNKDRREQKSERRAAVQDWVAVALRDLEEERDHLALYGVEKYLPMSIDRLKELMGPDSSTADEKFAA
jgi:hypothetical protein